MNSVRLDKFNNRSWPRGRPLLVELLWAVLQAALVSSFMPGSLHRRLLLRAFGARIGRGVVIKPRVRVKFPWRLDIGDHTWIGEGVWIDNLAEVRIGSHCCLSQGAYLCTGSHNWSTSTFDLLTMPIRIGDGAWISARATVGPGVIISEGAVLGLGSVATSNLDAWGIYHGAPAVLHKRRRLVGAYPSTQNVLPHPSKAIDSGGVDKSTACSKLSVDGCLPPKKTAIQQAALELPGNPPRSEGAEHLLITNSQKLG